MSDPERRLWWYLRAQINAKFRRQVPLGPYIVDFANFPSRLIVEVDGIQHGEQLDYDERRDRYLRRLGFRTIRFSTLEVMNEIEVVLDNIAGHVDRARA